MSPRRRAIVVVLILLVVIAPGVFATRGLPPATPNPPGTFSFAVLGDAPYYAWEDVQFRLVLRWLDAYDLSWVLHVGDIFWHPCTDEHYRRGLGWFNGLRHPVIYTPGDNEWSDCWEPGSGEYAPLERLRRLRQIFFASPTRSLGRRPLPLVSQGSGRDFPEFVENVRWSHAGLLFATVHLVGSRNGFKPFPRRSAEDDEAARRRTEAAAAWLRETFVEARNTGASAVIVGFQANPDFEEPAAHRSRQNFEPFLTALEEETERFGRPVLVVHGDGHEYIVDHPLLRRTTGRRLEQLTRMQVPGSPLVGWVRVTVQPGAAAPFSFEPHVLPRWKYW